uniref:LLM class flavin-dependent oxidoreductase n=1 Tax=Paractinoplanes polyasparticus TaxID=2856853 RepID=UPI001C84CF78|nr:LLM class flavin-dependent oxidoreductase [Actinoplanes polyasparticus]
MKIGIGLPNQVRNVDAQVIPAWAAQAESAGFSTVATIGRMAYPGVMDTVALALAAATTKAIGLFSAVLQGPAWPPVLLAKELAGIDAASGGRLTLGLGLGGRREDFVAEGYGPRGLGARLDRDLSVYREVWNGDPIAGTLPAVTIGQRRIPLIFGGQVQASFDRMAREGDGYVGGAVPAALVAPAFESARRAWQAAGRAGSPRLIGLAYAGLGDEETGRGNVHHYYSDLGAELAGLVSGSMAATSGDVRTIAAQFEEIGADELIFLSATDDLDDVDRLAGAIL